MLRRCGRLLLLIMACLPAPGAAQSTPASERRLVIAIGQTVTNIVPTLSRTAAEMPSWPLWWHVLWRSRGGARARQELGPP